MENVPNPDALFGAIELDRKLEAANSAGLEALAEHRWHWTLDESNPDRVSVAAYAERAGRTKQAIGKMVAGYAAWRDNQLVVSLADAIATANVSEERAHAIREVAKATGMTQGHVVKNEGRLVSDVRARAEELATRKRTSVADEIEHVAKVAAAQRKAEQRSRTERRASKSARLLAAEGRLATVQKVLRELLADAEAADYTDDEVQLILTLLRSSHALLQLVEVKLTGSTDVDWDAEMVKLGDPS